MPRPSESLSLELLDVQQGTPEGEVESLVLKTDAGDIPCHYHPAETGDAAVVWVGGAGGGLNGPAGGMYPRLAEQLRRHDIASLRLHYRHPNHLMHCVLDTLLGTVYLASRNRTRYLLVGHSFGGAVVITAGAAGEGVIGVAALSSQTYGTEAVRDLSPVPLLLLHGQADEVLPDACSRELYRRAGEPKRMTLYPGCRHGLDECREEVDRDLVQWILQVAAGGYPQ